VTKGAAAFTVMDALELATMGSAAVLGREDLGRLAPGMAADFIGLKLDQLAFAGGAVHDPVAALLLCTPRWVDLSVVNGKRIVEDGHIIGLDLERMIARHNELAVEMAAEHPI
jgi:cytosine/adenosine deaminase-related metal-dependent hydrolase